MTSYHNISSLLDFFLDSLSKCNSFITTFLFFIAMLPLVVFSTFYFQKQSQRKVYMLDFACFEAPTSLMSTRARTIEMCKFLSGNWDEELVDFITYGMDKTGLGDSTYLSEALVRVPPNPSMEASRKEAEMVMFGAIDELIAKTKNVIVSMDNIGILIVNCSVFNVVPCLASMIINRYDLREDISSYNVTGMGCSAGLLAIGLAKNLLQVHPDQYALVVSTEIISEQVYLGKDRSKIATNCLFRLGGSAILLSNLPSARNSSKYELLHNVHVNNAKSDISYNSIFLEEDPEGLIGITINKDLLVAAKSAMESNISILGQLILPLSEKFRFLINLLVRNYMASKLMPSRLRLICDISGFRNKTVPEHYVPKFNKCVGECLLPHRLKFHFVLSFLPIYIR
ncbi:hypothetical protein LIER_30487 [Lithospermum erythrorhizon]|uniref:FAE domain-containing protein n=1 Tax=Lithospermum erythrorhizon TaxID=34254 RepID=A0AAV3RQ19_LITER